MIAFEMVRVLPVSSITLTAVLHLSDGIIDGCAQLVADAELVGLVLGYRTWCMCVCVLLYVYM